MKNSIPWTIFPCVKLAFWLIIVKCKILKEMGISDHLSCLLRNLYASQEATVKTGHGTTDWLQIGKGVYQGCIALISHVSKVMLKILQARLQEYVNRELPDVQAGFRKAEEPEIKLPTSVGSLKKQNSRKTSAFLTTPKPLIVWITRNCGIFFKRWEYQTGLPPEKSACRSRSNS